MDFILIFLAKYLIYLMVVVGLIFFVFLSKTLKKQFLATTLLSFVIAYSVGKVASHFFYNARPFVLTHTLPLIKHAANNGFPSDHALFSASIAFVVFSFNKRVGVFLFLLTLFVGYARIVIGLHHIVDILGSIVIAAISSYIGYILVRNLIKK